VDSVNVFLFGFKVSETREQIESKIKIFKDILVLEDEIKNKEKKTDYDQKKLESLEAIKKEFKESFKKEEEPKLLEEEKEGRKKINSKKRSKRNKN